MTQLAKLEAVTVCVDYADLLAATLPHNRPYVDRLVVVTKPHDLETQDVCAKYDTECITTHAFGPNGGFCKGAGINRALAERGRRIAASVIASNADGERHAWTLPTEVTG